MNPRTRLRRARVVLVGVLASCAPRPGPAPERPCPGCTAYEAELSTWRARRADDLRAEQGWLALAGLYWLSDGTHRLGADPRSDIVFPPGAPADIGTVTLAGGEVHLHVADGVDARVAPEPALSPVPVRDIALRSDADPDVPADRVALGDRFTFMIIARGGRLGVRIYDRDAPPRRDFAGLDWFPVDPRWRIAARFEPYVPPQQIDHPTVVGTPQKAVVPGVAVFTLAGREHRLTPILEHSPDGDQLLFVFSDETSGRDTYRGGRFLLTGLAVDGALELDFNRAVNPPCAFTAYATCPTPLRDNHLPLPVDAGEKLYRGAH